MVPVSEPQAQDPYGEGAVAAKARRMRSIMIAVALVAFVIVVFAVTMLKLSANALHAVPQT
jgi:flagellar basal body-associated protein FliL